MKNILLCLTLLSSCMLYGNTLEVSLDGTHQYTSIQVAVDASQNNDTILIYPGRYVENVNLNGHNVTLASLYSISPQQAYIDSTIIDGNLRVCVKIESGETANLLGLTLVNNEAGHNNYLNDGLGGGGGVRISNNSIVQISKCIIRDCIAGYGGGFSIGHDSLVHLSSTRIYNNRAIYMGGGINLNYGNNIIFDNQNLNSVYQNTAPMGMDIFIWYREDYPETVQVVLSLGSVTMSQPDGYYILAHQATVSANIAQGYFQEIDNDVYVNPYGNDNNDGLSEISPFKTIKHALQIISSNAENPHTVHLAAGTYSFSANNQLFPQSLKQHVRIVGAGSDLTLLDGEFTTTFFAGWDKNDFRIFDLSFIHGRGNLIHPIDISDSENMEFRNLVFHDCQGYLTSGIYLLRSNNIICENLDFGGTSVADWNVSLFGTECTNLYVNGVISHDNTITDSDYSHLGLEFYECDMTIRNCIINHNVADDAYIFHYQTYYTEHSSYQLNMSNILIFNNNITNCYWAFAPVYIQNRYNVPIISNCTFANNQGQGYFFQIFGSADISNMILDNPQCDGEMYFHNDLNEVGVIGDVTLRNSLFRLNDVNVELPDHITYTDNITDRSPLFLGTTTDTLSLTQPEYYYLSANSPCIDTGLADTTGLNIPIMDLAGNYRIWNNRIDMGCYEYGSTPVGNEEQINDPEVSSTKISTFPNPVVMSGTRGAYVFIEFTLPQRAQEPPRIEIFNIKGQCVKSMKLNESYTSLVQKAGLSKDVKQNGEFFSTVWDCKNDQNQKIASGLYIVRVTSGNHHAVKKMMVVK